MGFRLRRSMQLLPGVHLNLSKSGLGLSLGVRGARVSLNPRYGARTSAGIPGTGLSYSKKIGSKKRSKSQSPLPHSSTISRVKKSAKTSAPRQVHLVLYSPLGEKHLADNSPSDLSLLEYLETMEVGDGSHLSLVDSLGYVQAFRSGKKLYRIEWRSDQGKTFYISEQPAVTAVRIFQNFANGNDISHDAQWKSFTG